MKARRPDLPVIFMSGYTQDSAVFKGGGEGSRLPGEALHAAGFLSKVGAALDYGAFTRFGMLSGMPEERSGAEHS